MSIRRFSLLLYVPCRTFALVTNEAKLCILSYFYTFIMSNDNWCPGFVNICCWVFFSRCWDIIEESPYWWIIKGPIVVSIGVSFHITPLLYFTLSNSTVNLLCFNSSGCVVIGKFRSHLQIGNSISASSHLLNRLTSCCSWTSLGYWCRSWTRG